jgi:condensin complex subunit 3
MLFLHIFAKGTESMQVIIIQIIADLLTGHPSLLAEPLAREGEEEPEPNQNIKPIYKIFSKSLRAPDNAVQSNGCIALSKLMLAGTIQDQDLLKQLVLAYFDPETQSNPSLRQSLSYFLPVFCHSKRQNAETMARIAVNVIHTLSERADDLDEEEEMVGMNLVVAQLCDWTDPRKCVPMMDKLAHDITQDELDGHAVLAEEVLEKILTPGCNKEERKHYISVFSKLYIGPTVPAQHLRTIHDLLSEALEGRVANEASARNSLTKLQTSIAKLLLNVEDDEEKPESSTERAPADDILEETIIPDADDGDVVDAGDLTMLTKPDHEGTVFMDYDDEEDDSEEVDITTGLAKRHTEDSLVESLLSEDDEMDVHDTIS